MIRRLLINQGNREGIAVVEGDTEVRYIDLMKKAWAIQAALSRENPGNAAILLPNGGDYIAALWGAFQAGRTALPLNALMTAHEILPLLEQASVRTVITNDIYRRHLEDALSSGARQTGILCVESLDMARELAIADMDAEEPMLLMSTSGTTGKSKIVQLSEHNIEAAVLGYLDKLCVEEEEMGSVRYTLAAPFGSIYGVMILSACLMRSYPLVVLDDAFTLDALYQAAEKHGVTRYEGSTSAVLLMEQMAGRPIPYDVHRLRYFGFGGSKVSGKVIDKLLGAYPGVGFFQGYGMTEASPLIAKHPQRKPLKKTDSVGTAVKGMEIAIETDGGITRAPYSEGEIVVKGPGVMLGYLGNISETNRVLKNGYLYTGDIGYLDDEGYLFLCGRKKNMIIVRGFKVYPEEVEDCLQNSGLVAKCLVYGKPDGFGGEMVCADVVPAHPNAGEEEIRAYCEAHLAEFKRPRAIALRGAIPQTASGKVERR